MQPLADAAKSRSEADWLVGINGTRAMTAFNSKDGGFFLTTVGRVQTPTLALVVSREEKIRSFVPRNYWEVHADFKANAGIYEGKYFDPAFKKSSDPDLKAERLWSAGRGAENCRRGQREERHGNRNIQTFDFFLSGPLRPDHTAARSQLPLRLLR